MVTTHLQNFCLQSWDDEIAMVAQTYAENCVYAHDSSYHRIIPGRLFWFTVHTLHAFPKHRLILSLKLPFGEANHRFYCRKFATIKPDDLPPQMTIFNKVIPILLIMHFCSFSLWNYTNLHQIVTSTTSNVKPDVSQWNATLRNDVGFPTVNRWILL